MAFLTHTIRGTRGTGKNPMKLTEFFIAKTAGFKLVIEKTYRMLELKIWVPFKEPMDDLIYQKKTVVGAHEVTFCKQILDVY